MPNASFMYAIYKAADETQMSMQKKQVVDSKTLKSLDVDQENALLAYWYGTGGSGGVLGTDAGKVKYDATAKDSGGGWDPDNVQSSSATLTADQEQYSKDSATADANKGTLDGDISTQQGIVSASANGLNQLLSIVQSLGGLGAALSAALASLPNR